MRIIYIHQYFNTPNMSGSTRSYEMARRMVDAGHEVHMVTSYRDKTSNNLNWYTTMEQGINVHWCPIFYSNHMGYIARIKSFIKFALSAAKRAIKIKGDIIFATSTPLTIAIPAVYASRKLKIPMVFEVRDLWPEMPIAMGALKNPVLKIAARKLERWAYLNASAVVALSPGMKEGIIKAGYPSCKIAVIPNSSDNFEFQYNAEAAHQFRYDRPWLGNNPLLIYAGTFGKVNGVDYIVQVAKELKDIESNIKILLVGEGSEKEKIICLAKKLEVFENVVFFEGALPKKDVSALFSAATMTSNLVIDLPEASANSANKFFDSLAASKPILLNHGGWMHEVITHHGSGISVWKKDFKEVATILEQKMNDDEWLKKSGDKAKELALKHFDRDKLAQQLIQVLVMVNDSNGDVESLASSCYL